jgi:deoxyribodipyrimidine photolyase
MEQKDNLELTPELVSDLTKLNKTELISVLRQKIVAESNTQIYMAEAKREVERVKKENEELYADFTSFRNKVAKVLETNTQHHQQQMQLVFNTLHNLEAIMKSPDYSFLNDQATEPSPKE